MSECSAIALGGRQRSTRDPVDRRTGRERVGEVLRERILAGELAPGERIDLDKYAAEFGTSRTPVREAATALCAGRTGEGRPAQRVTVIGVSPESTIENFQPMAALSGVARGRRARSPNGTCCASKNPARSVASQSGGHHHPQLALSRRHQPRLRITAPDRHALGCGQDDPAPLLRPVPRTRTLLPR